MLSYNDIRIDKEIKPGRPESSDTDAGAESGRAVTVCSSRLADQSRLACDQIVAWRVDGIPNAKLACLARVNALLLPVQVALVLAEVPATRVVGPEVLNRTGIAAVLAYLRIAGAVAARALTTLSALGECNGIGPRRLEDYGDDILAAIESVRAVDSS